MSRCGWISSTLSLLLIAAPAMRAEEPTAAGSPQENANPGTEKNDKFKLKIGLMGDRILTRKDLDALSKLPSREVMLATLLGTMKAPISGMVNVCAGVIRGFVNCVNEVKKQKESQPQQA